MKSKLPVLVALCSLLTAGVAAEDSSPQSPAIGPSAEPPSPSEVASPATARSTKTAAAPAVAAPTESPAKISPSLAASRAAEEAKRAHIIPASGPFKMETPPPAPRTETKTPAPAAGYVWMPGHWTPVKGQWEWTPGEWGNPPTAASVWIEGKYDPKTRQWTAGYWQPDRPDSYEPDVQKEVTSPARPR